jgi:hypothetical protein
LHSLFSAAVKGSSHAQKNFLDRVERLRAQEAAEIEESHKFWREYCTKTYPAAVERLRKAGREVPDDWTHPEDVVLEEGRHVMFRGGGDPDEAKKNRDYVVGLRDAHMLQIIKDERSFGAKLKDTPIFLSGLLAAWANTSLPKRLQLDDTQYLLRLMRNNALRTSELKRRLRESWTALGHPAWADIVLPPLRKDALERLRNFKWEI